MKSLSSSVTAIARAANESKSAAAKNFKNLFTAVNEFGAEIEKVIPSFLPSFLLASSHYLSSGLNWWCLISVSVCGGDRVLCGRAVLSV